MIMQIHFDSFPQSPCPVLLLGFWCVHCGFNCCFPWPSLILKITGISGFLATHVVAKALKAGYSIHGWVFIVYPAMQPKHWMFPISNSRTVRSAEKGTAIRECYIGFGDKFDIATIEDISSNWWPHRGAQRCVAPCQAKFYPFTLCEKTLVPSSMLPHLLPALWKTQRKTC